ncbi:hypothetical protein GTA08_BOTSDO09387 [Botryosphaeria dothidea]|uniref:Uncharacterized protein n=1 Tax=Botryosphaeria dothidea TaxID=55169 RepID=A0A8H4IL66_9PEZI|nr:hypothetical protein GTA08_BOTSDO09387 [Botryosphaeria dothidea]
MHAHPSLTTSTLLLFLALLSTVIPLSSSADLAPPPLLPILIPDSRALIPRVQKVDSHNNADTDTIVIAAESDAATTTSSSSSSSSSSTSTTTALRTTTTEISTTRVVTAVASSSTSSGGIPCTAAGRRAVCGNGGSGAPGGMFFGEGKVLGVVVLCGLVVPGVLVMGG